MCVCVCFPRIDMLFFTGNVENYSISSAIKSGSVRICDTRFLASQALDMYVIAHLSLFNVVKDSSQYYFSNER
jgi:hypothetical protein